MKRLALIICAVMIIITTGCSDTTSTHEDPITDYRGDLLVTDMRGVWISYFEFYNILAGKTENQYTLNVKDVVQKCKNGNINTIFLHVRPFCDAFYPSNVFPWSYYSLSYIGEAPSFDPLKIFVQVAHENNIDVHAWINPYRISYDTDKNKLNAGQIDFLSQYENSIIECSQGYWLDPSSSATLKLVINGVSELLEGYDIDGIHMDDYFYPVTDESFDADSYSLYQAEGGEASLGDWRRENVNNLVKNIYNEVKKHGKEKIFSISPQADIDADIDKYYADVDLWCSDKGYIDLIIPQIYFGYTNQHQPFARACRKWEKLVTADAVSLVCGLASYKQADKEQTKGATDAAEWEAGGVIEKQIADIESNKSWQGYCLYSFSYSFS